MQELIPEFYDTDGAGDFLVNKFKINFGTKHDGQPVNNVVLPPWAKGSPELFVNKLRWVFSAARWGCFLFIFLILSNREALESDFVSLNLHHWIDLIFGFKQRGEDAYKADNCMCVF